MAPGSIFEDLTPHARVATALLPFLGALVCRLIFGKNRVTRWLLSLSTTWFAINVLLAPYSIRMQQDLVDIRSLFR
jgi:hypothetical protein